MKIENNRSAYKSVLYEDDSETFDIKKVFGNIMDKWYYFIFGTILSLLLAFLVIRYSNPVYEINTEMMVEEQNGSSSGSSLSQGSGLFKDLGGAFNLSSTVENEEEMLKARSLMYSVVKDLQLNVTYYKKEQIRKIETFEKTPYQVHLVEIKNTVKPFVLHWKEVNSASYDVYDSKDKKVLTANYGSTVTYKNCSFSIDRNRNIKISKEDANKFYFQVTSYDNTTAAYQKNLAITVPSDKANAIDISITSQVPSKGEFVLNYFIQRYLRSSLEQRNQIADSTLSFINTRLSLVTGELSNIENQIALYKGNNKIISPDAQAQLLANTSSDNFKQNSQLDLQLDIIHSLKNYIGDESNNKRIVPSNLATADPNFTQIVAKYNTLMIERDRVSLNYPDTNPLLQNIDMQLSNLRKDMISNLSSSQNNIIETKKHLTSDDRSLNARIFVAPNVEKGYLELAREQKIKEALYLFLIQRREEVAISRSSNMAKATVIDEPKALAEPVAPNKLIIYIAFLIAGLLIPAIVFYIRSVLNTKVLTKEDINKKTQIAVLAEIGHVSGNNLMVTNTSRSEISEQFKTLRTNLQSVLRNKNQSVIMITSGMSNEGKSFVSLNLANVFALANKKVLLIDFDLRNPNIHQYLQLPDNEGVTNYLLSETDVEKIIKNSGIHPNLYVAGAGAISQNPNELLLHPKMDDLFAFAKNNFDCIIIDSAPIGVMSDAQILSKYADVTLYVARQKVTLKSHLSIVEDIYENEKIKNLYILFNDVKSQKKYGFSNGKKYYYNKDSGNKYINKKKKFTGIAGN